MSTPDDLEARHTLLTAVARHDELRRREPLSAPDGTGCRLDPDITPLTRDETLELLALGEVIARKVTYGRQLSIRSARTAGASWSLIGAALGTSKQAAWEAHGRWSDEELAAARTLARPTPRPGARP
jgi:hypothetical protein